MKRDMELIKKIMLNIENDEPTFEIQGYEKNSIFFHQKLLIDAGYLEGKYLLDGSRPVDVNITNITYHGYDFLDILKDDDKFKVLKDLGKQLSLEVLKTLIIKAITPN